MVLQTIFLTILAYAELFLLRGTWFADDSADRALMLMREKPLEFLNTESQWAALCLIMAVCAVAISSFLTKRLGPKSARISGPVLSLMLTIGFVLGFAKAVTALIFDIT